MKSNIWSGVAPPEASNKGVGTGTCCLFYAPYKRKHTQVFILTIAPSFMSLIALLQILALAWKYFYSSLMEKSKK